MANLYQNPQFVNNSAPALNAANMNALADAAAANQSYSIPVTIPASGWSGNAITITATGVTNTTEGFLVLAQNASASQAQMAGRAYLRVTGQSGNSITIAADGLVPTESIPCVIKVVSSGAMNAGSITSAITNTKNYITTTVTLTSGGWSNNTQTVSVAGVSSSSLVEVSPAPTSFDNYVNAGILCTAQGAGTLTFTCKTVPANNITVNVVIWN